MRRQGRYRLTPEDALAIRKDMRPVEEIARDWGKTTTTIHNIIAGRTFPHLLPQEGDRTYQKGKRRGRKLDDLQVIEILADPRKPKVIAAHYKVGLSTVYALKRGRSRGHVVEQRSVEEVRHDILDTLAAQEAEDAAKQRQIAWLNENPDKFSFAQAVPDDYFLEVCRENASHPELHRRTSKNRKGWTGR
jgi:predicted transcriptional regulator